MKIVFVTSGSFKKIATLKRATGMASPLIKRGHEVTILMEDDPSNREKAASECPEAKIVWHKSGLSSIKERFAKQHSLNSLKPDLVWICSLGLRNFMSRPIANTILFVEHSELYSHVGSSVLRKLLYTSIERASYSRYDGHICASRYLEKHYIQKLKIHKKDSLTHYCQYAYHECITNVDNNRVSQLKERFKNKRVILYLGSFWKNYGFWDMLETAKELSKTRSDFILLLAGRGPEEEAGVKWVEDSGLNEFVNIEGYIPEEDLSAYFTTAHAFISPLRDTIQDWARCPSKLFMYIPFQKPIITTAIGEAKELFRDDGFYYKPGSLKSMCRAIQRALDTEETTKLPKASMHTYESRTDSFLNWLECNKVSLKKKETKNNLC